MLNPPNWHDAVLAAKRIWYGSRGEPIQYGRHLLRYIPGTRPVRLKYVDSPDLIVRNDARQIAFLMREVKTGQFVIDIGGNVGQYAVLLSSLVGPSGKVITFEPDANHRNVLLRNLRLNGFLDRADVEGLALSDTNGLHTFFSRNDQMSSLVRSGLGTNAASLDVKEQAVETTRLDDYLEDRKLRQPNLVKIDTEGAEVNILRAARTLLASKATIICELHPYAWPEFNTSYAELLTIVADSKREIRCLDESRRIEDGAFHGTVVIS